jgi:hypothetical protein
MAVELVAMWVGGMEALMAGHLEMTKAYMTVEWKAHMLDVKKVVKKVDQMAPLLVAHLVV